MLCESLSPTPHVNDIVSRAHKRAMLISRAFISWDVSILIRAYLAYVRPLLEYNSVIWSPYSVKDIQAQRARPVNTDIRMFERSVAAEQIR